MDFSLRKNYVGIDTFLKLFINNTAAIIED